LAQDRAMSTASFHSFGALEEKDRRGWREFRPHYCTFHSPPGLKRGKEKRNCRDKEGGKGGQVEHYPFLIRLPLGSREKGGEREKRRGRKKTKSSRVLILSSTSFHTAGKEEKRGDPVKERRKRDFISYYDFYFSDWRGGKEEKGKSTEERKKNWEFTSVLPLFSQQFLVVVKEKGKSRHEKKGGEVYALLTQSTTFLLSSRKGEKNQRKDYSAKLCH